MLGIGVSASVYMNPFYEALTPLGYKDKVDLFSYGYDVRRIGDNNYSKIYFEYLKEKLESIFVKSNKKIILLSHSLGCPTTIYFLNYVGSVWSNKHIKKFIAFAPAWGGGWFYKNYENQYYMVIMKVSQ
jgi:lysophospholipase III